MFARLVLYAYLDVPWKFILPNLTLSCKIELNLIAVWPTHNDRMKILFRIADERRKGGVFMEQIRPAQSIIACGPMQDTKRFFRRAMYRKFTDVEMVEHEAELRARIAEEPPEGVLLCLPEPDCSRVTAWLRAEYPEIRLCSVTEQDRLLVNCPWSATYLPLPPPLTWERAGQAMYWFGYKEEGQPESQYIHVIFCGQDLSGALLSIYGTDLRILCYHNSLDAMDEIIRGVQCDILVVESETGEGLPPVSMTLGNQTFLMLHSAVRPSGATVTMLRCLLDRLRRERQAEPQATPPVHT